MRAPVWATVSSATPSAAACCCIWSTAPARIRAKPTDVVRGELESYGHGLADKPEIVALSKADAMTPEAIKTQTAKLKNAAGKPPLMFSAQSGQGVQEALRALVKVIDKAGPKAKAREGVL